MIDLVSQDRQRTNSHYSTEERNKKESSSARSAYGGLKQEHLDNITSNNLLLPSNQT
jgi:hypothetical protein